METSSNKKYYKKYLKYKSKYCLLKQLGGLNPATGTYFNNKALLIELTNMIQNAMKKPLELPTGKSVLFFSHTQFNDEYIRPIKIDTIINLADIRLNLIGAFIVRNNTLEIFDKGMSEIILYAINLINCTPEEKEKINKAAKSFLNHTQVEIIDLSSPSAYYKLPNLLSTLLPQLLPEYRLNNYIIIDVTTNGVKVASLNTHEMTSITKNETLKQLNKLYPRVPSLNGGDLKSAMFKMGKVLYITIIGILCTAVAIALSPDLAVFILEHT